MKARSILAGAVAVALYGVIGALVGLVCGRPLWRQETIWTPILKGLFGFGLGVGAAFAGRKFLGGVHLPLAMIPGATERALPDRVSQSNVLLQLEHLATYPAVRQGVANKTLSLAGWWFDIASGEVHVYDPLTRSFGRLSREAIDRITG
jgi:hypothetical protein